MLGVEVARQYLGCNRNDDEAKLDAFIKSQARDGDIIEDVATTAWCAGFINACERAVGNDGTGSLAALSFKNYGTSVNIEDAQEGDIIVFVFSFDSPGHGHVTYFENFKGFDKAYVTCLGGNQSDNVQESTYGVNSIVAVRRP